MHPSDNLRLLTISYNVVICEGGPVVERQATILTDKKPWKYLLDPDIENDKPGTYVTLLHNVVEIPSYSLTPKDIEELLGRG
jgi:hypothetical protein